MSAISIGSAMRIRIGTNRARSSGRTHTCRQVMQRRPSSFSPRRLSKTLSSTLATTHGPAAISPKSSGRYNTSPDPACILRILSNVPWLRCRKEHLPRAHLSGEIGNHARADERWVLISWIWNRDVLRDEQEKETVSAWQGRSRLRLPAVLMRRTRQIQTETRQKRRQQPGNRLEAGRGTYHLII